MILPPPFHSSDVYCKAISNTIPNNNNCIAIVTGGRSGIGKAIVTKIASFPIIEYVIAVSRSIQSNDHNNNPKIIPLAVDITTQSGRNDIIQTVHKLCHDDTNYDNNSGNIVRNKRQLRFLIHNAGTIEPIKSILDITEDELRYAMILNCEAPLLLSSSLYPYMMMQPKITKTNDVVVDTNNNTNDETTTSSSFSAPGRILHVSSGAAHGVPPIGWSVYSITKAAFFQSYLALGRELRGKQYNNQVLVSSFKPGIVDTPMQSLIRNASIDVMPVVTNFQQMKVKADELTNQQSNDDDITSSNTTTSRPPPSGALDTPENVANYVEYLLLGMTDDEYSNIYNPIDEHDIRDTKHHSLWIP